MGISRRAFLQSGTGFAALACAGRLGAAEKPGMAGVATGPGHLQQEIAGFGFSEAFHMARAIQGLEEKDRTDLLNLMFSGNGGMGYSILRNQIGEGPLPLTPGNVASIEPAPDQFNWTGDEVRWPILPAADVWAAGQSAREHLH